MNILFVFHLILRNESVLHLFKFDLLSGMPLWYDACLLSMYLLHMAKHGSFTNVWHCDTLPVVPLQL